MQTKIIFDFEKKSNIENWSVVDDVVMGGKSSGLFELNDEKNGVFKGHISLKNNGGFSSIKYKFSKIFIGNASKICLKIKGDGKIYQFRIKSKFTDKHAYISFLSTNMAWQTIEIHLKDMYPTYRGKKLILPNFSDQYIEEIAFLIANQKEENFELLIKKIELK